MHYLKIESNGLLIFIEGNFLIQGVQETTLGNRILNLILTNTENIVENVTVIEHLANIGHKIIRFTMTVCIEVKKFVQFVKFERPSVCRLLIGGTL